MQKNIDFETNPSIYKHWELKVQNNIAYLIMKVDEDEGFFDGYKLKLNSYDIGVDIELADAVQRLRFENPNVTSVIIKSGRLLSCFVLIGSSTTLKILLAAAEP